MQLAIKKRQKYFSLPEHHLAENLILCFGLWEKTKRGSKRICRGETFHNHIHICRILGNREWNRSLNSFTSVMKKKMSSNAITRWLEGWVSQAHQRYVLSIRRTYLTPQKEIKSFKFAVLCITKLKALLIKSFSNPSVSSKVLTPWKCDCCLTKLFRKFSKKFQIENPWQSPQRLSNFETVTCKFAFAICWIWALSRMFNFSRNFFPEHLLSL